MLDTSTDLNPSDQQNQSANRNIILAARSGSVAFVGKIILNVIMFLSGVIMARFLGAYLFGLFRVALSFVNVLSGLCLLGLSGGVVRYIPLARHRKDKELLWSVVQTSLIVPTGVGLILGFCLFLFAEPIATQFFKDPDLIPVFQMLSLQVPLGALLTMTTTIAQGFKKIEQDTYRTIAYRTLKLVLVITLLLLGFGLPGVIIAQIISSLFGIGLLIYFLHQFFPLSRSLTFNKDHIIEFFRFSLPLYLSRLLKNLGGQFETLVLGFFGMTAGAGIFVAAASINSVSNLLHSSLGSIATPIFAELHAKEKLDELKNFYQVVTRWAITFSLPYFLTMLFFGHYFLLIFGNEFQTGGLSLIILALGTLFNAATGQCGSMINMIGQSKLSAINSFLYLVVTIVLDFLLIPRWGIEGAALAASLTIMLINLLRMIEVYYYLRFWPVNISVLKPVGASLIAAGSVYLVNQQLDSVHFIIQIAVGTAIIWAIYILLIILFKFSPEDHLILDKFKKRFNINFVRK